jgi:hypothetical protein
MSPEAALASLLALAVISYYLSFSASRLDRLHHRVESSANALDAQLVRRAEAAVELATSGAVDPASGLLLADAASRALEAGEQNGQVAGPERWSVADGAGAVEREQSESALSQALRATVDRDLVEAVRADALLGPLVVRLAQGAHRVELARRFHNDAVTDARRVRSKGVVRWLRLAGRAPLPRTFEMDDVPPDAFAAADVRT